MPDDEKIAAPRSLDLSHELHNMAAQGGAVGAVVLGIWAIVSSLITYFAFVNAILAIILGVYGLQSRSRVLAGIGIAMGVIAILLSMMEISESIGSYYAGEQEF